MKILLDTTALIDILKGNERAISKLEEIKKGATIYTSTINIYEVIRGVNLIPSLSARKRHLDSIKVLISNLHVLSLDIEASEYAASIYSSLRLGGFELDEHDYLIAGIGLANDIRFIMTRNGKHFEKVSGLSVISYSI